MIYFLFSEMKESFRSKQAAAWAKISHGQLAPAEDNDTDDRQLENLEDQLNGLLDDLKDSPDYEQLKERIQYLIDPNEVPFFLRTGSFWSVDLWSIIEFSEGYRSSNPSIKLVAFDPNITHICFSFVKYYVSKILLALSD